MLVDLEGSSWKYILFLPTKSSASKPSFHRILTDRTTDSIILKSRTEADHGPAVCLHLEMVHLGQGWCFHKVSILMGQNLEPWPQDYNLGEARLD